MPYGYEAQPRIKLTIMIPQRLEAEFERWLGKTWAKWPWPPCKLRLMPLGLGYRGHVDVVDAEKIVEWLKDHGINNVESIR